MSKKNEDSVERFFRKAVAQHDTPFRESDWLQMEKMLDESAREKTAVRVKRLKQGALSLIGLILISLSVYFLAFDDNPAVDSKNDLSTEMQAAAGAEAPTDEAKVKNPTAGLLSLNNDSASGPPESRHADPEQVTGARSEHITAYKPGTFNTEEATIPEAKPSEATVFKKDTFADRQTQKDIVPLPADVTGTENDKPSVYRQQEVIVKKEPAGEKETPEQNTAKALNEDEGLLPLYTAGDESDTQSGEGKALSEKDTDDNAVAVEGLPDAGIAKDKEAVEEEKQTVHPEALPPDEQKEEPSISQETQLSRARWSIALVVAPDFSSTVLGRYTSPGEALGIVAGYRLSRRITINTGLLRSTKKYEGYGNDYQPPKGYWLRRTNGIVPKEIFGTCVVYEIPILLQYSLVQKQKSTVYFAAGLSSYRMTSESYTYQFEDPNPGAAEGWSTSQASSYLFNIAHLSAAYERQVSHRLSVGLEPYLKIPFAGMGWSNVDLFSTGIFINLRYNVAKRKRIE